VKRLILATVAFAPGVFLLAAGHDARSEPLPFVLGLAVCIVAGAILIKAIRDYLK